MALPTIRQLQFLAALGETGSFTRAAEFCHVTQPTLSAAIRDLELLLGVRLAEREAKGIRLTSAGRKAVEGALSVLAATHELIASVRDASRLLAGPFNLGAIPTIAPYVLPQAMVALRTAYPELELYLREDQTDRLIKALRLRTLDAALIALPWEASGIESIPLVDDELLLATPSDHWLATKLDPMPADLKDQDLLLLEDGHCLREHALSACSIRRRRGRTEVSATSLNTLVNMVSGGLGVSLLPRLAVGNGLSIGPNVRVRPFAQPLVGRSIGIAWARGSARSEEARLIGNVVRLVIGEGHAPAMESRGDAPSVGAVDLAIAQGI